VLTEYKEKLICKPYDVNADKFIDDCIKIVDFNNQELILFKIAKGI
jgi:hypothetical protein